jgi:citrate synthase
MSTSNWISAADAAAILHVGRATLYAYVSRGRIRSQVMPGSTRQRVYARDDVERMRRRAEERRDPEKAAAGALQWGVPVLESGITLIDGRTLFYRGHDARTLARSRTVQEVASLIWTGGFDAGWLQPPHASARAAARRLPYAARARAALAIAAADDPQACDTRPQSVAHCGWRILHVLAALEAGAIKRHEALDAALARAWSVTRGGADVLRVALILCADHELNVSSFTARCIASAGSSPYAVVTGGLAALEGPRHGGAGARVESMLGSLRGAKTLRQALGDRIRRGEPLEGFGHPLYPDGDPRAVALLAQLRECHPRSAQLAFVERFAAVARDAVGERPNVDFALAAVGRVLELPAGAPFVLFALGRTIGWIGHAIEQYATGHLIRPRANYVGVRPSEPGTP